MIIQQSVFTALFLLNRISDLELFDAAIKSFQKQHHADLVHIGSYKRDMITLSKSMQRRELSVLIPRVRMQSEDGSKGSSHAVLPDILIPFGSYTIRFILHVIYAFSHRSCSVANFCERWQISLSTLYDWKHLCEVHQHAFEKHLRIARQNYENLCSSASSISSFPHQFFMAFGISFLQSRYRLFDPPVPCHASS